MRRAGFEEIGGPFEYEFGSDVSIIYAVMHMPNVQGDGLYYEVRLKGGELIEFIKENALRHQEVISKIDPEKEYRLSAWDW